MSFKETSNVILSRVKVKRVQGRNSRDIIAKSALTLLSKLVDEI